jgi:hypothetical protein
MKMLQTTRKTPWWKTRKITKTIPLEGNVCRLFLSNFGVPPQSSTEDINIKITGNNSTTHIG